MHSARTEPASGRFATVRGWFQRLNVRLVIALASIALVALLVSGIALSQILPGYFLDQARAQRRRRRPVHTRSCLPRTVQRVAADPASAPRHQGAARHHRSSSRWPQVAANELAQGTVEIHYNGDGSLAARAVPDAGDGGQTWRRMACCPIPTVPVQSELLTIPIPRPVRAGGQRSVVSEPYTNRVATLQRVSGTLLGAGLAALAVSLIVGAAGCAPADRAAGDVCVGRRAAWRRASWTSGRRASGSSRSTSWGSSSTSWPIG